MRKSKINLFNSDLLLSSITKALNFWEAHKNINLVHFFWNKTFIYLNFNSFTSFSNLSLNSFQLLPCLLYQKMSLLDSLHQSSKFL